MKIAVSDNHKLIREGINTILTNNDATCVDKCRTAMKLLPVMDGGNYITGDSSKTFRQKCV